MIQKRYQNWAFQSIAIFLVALMLWEIPAQAAPAPMSEVVSDQRSVIRDQIRPESLVGKIKIPSALGSIQEASSSSVARGSWPVELIHIEDAHGEPEAQKNIEAILTHLKKNYGINTFFLEGAWSKLEPSLLQLSEDAAENKKILSDLTEKGIVGGPENFLYENSQNQEPGTKNHVEAGGMTSGGASLGSKASVGSRQSVVAGYGVEDLDLYRKNLKQFRTVMGAKTESDHFLDELKAALLTKASQVLNPDLAAYFRQWSFQEEVQADYSAHLRVLAAQAQKHLKIDLNDPREQYDWPMLVRFFKLKEPEKKQEPGTKNQEIEKLKKWAADKLDLKGIKSIIDLSSRDPGSWSLVHGSVREMFETFYEAAAPLGFRFKDYPVLAKEWGKQILAQEMQAPQLLDEMKKIEQKLLEKLAQTPDEKKLIQKYREFLLLKKLLYLELSSEEWKQIRTKNQEPSTKAEIDAREFYETAEARDQAMFSRTIDWIKKEKIEKAVIVTGGFHSQGMSELFKKQNIFYLRIQPRITQIKGRTDYLKRMMPAVSHLRAMSPEEPRPFEPQSWRAEFSSLAVVQTLATTGRPESRGFSLRQSIADFLFRGEEQAWRNTYDGISPRSPREAALMGQSIQAVRELKEPVVVKFIIPMFKEEKRLAPRSVENPDGENALYFKVLQLEHLRLINPLFDFKLTLVDDGTPDEKTIKMAEAMRAKLNDEQRGKIEILRISPEEKKKLGSRKGGAVIYGMRHTLQNPMSHQRQLIGYTDVDDSASMMLAGLLVKPIMDGQAQVSAAARRGLGAESRGRSRAALISSRLYNRALRFILPDLRGITDTQTGFKLFTEEALASTLPWMQDQAWSFDSELLSLTAMHGFKIATPSIAWFDSRDASQFSKQALRNGKEALLRVWNIQRPHVGRFKALVRFLENQRYFKLEDLRQAVTAYRDMPERAIFKEIHAVGRRKLIRLSPEIQSAASARYESRAGIKILKGGRSGVLLSEADEEVALTDDKGKILEGQKAKKDIAHKQGLHHMSAHIYLVDSKGRIVFQRRSQNKASSKGKLQFSISGHVDFGELPIAAAVREAEEEVSIRIETDKLIKLTEQNEIYREYDLEDGRNREFTTAYLYFVSDEELERIRQNYNLNEVDEFQLTPVDVFESDVWQHPEQYSRTLHYLASSQGEKIWENIKTLIAERSEMRNSEKQKEEENVSLSGFFISFKIRYSAFFDFLHDLFFTAIKPFFSFRHVARRDDAQQSISKIQSHDKKIAARFRAALKQMVDLSTTQNRRIIFAGFFGLVGIHRVASDMLDITPIPLKHQYLHGELSPHAYLYIQTMSIAGFWTAAIAIERISKYLFINKNNIILNNNYPLSDRPSEGKGGSVHGSKNRAETRSTDSRSGQVREKNFDWIAPPNATARFESIRAKRGNFRGRELDLREMTWGYVMNHPKEFHELIQAVSFEDEALPRDSAMEIARSLEKFTINLALEDKATRLPIAMVQGGLDLSPKSGKKTEVVFHNFSVHFEFQGSGITSWLLYQLLTQAQSKGAKEVIWSVEKTHERAIRYYEKIGGRTGSKSKSWDLFKKGVYFHGNIQEMLPKLEEDFKNKQAQRSEDRSTFGDRARLVRAEMLPPYLLAPDEHVDAIQRLLAAGLDVNALPAGLKKMIKQLGREEKYVIGRGMDYGSSLASWGQGRKLRPEMGLNVHESTDLIYLEDLAQNRRSMPEGTTVPAFFNGGKAHWIFDDNMRSTAAFKHPIEINWNGKVYAFMTVYMHLELEPVVKIGEELTAGNIVGKITASRKPSSPVAPHVHFAAALVEKKVLGALPAGNKEGDFYRELHPYEENGDIRWLDFREFLSKESRDKMFIEGDAAQSGFEHLVVVNSDEEAGKKLLVQIGRSFPGIPVYRFQTVKEFQTWRADHSEAPVAVFSTQLGHERDVWEENQTWFFRMDHPDQIPSIISSVRNIGRFIRRTRSKMRASYHVVTNHTDLFAGDKLVIVFGENQGVYEILEVENIELTPEFPGGPQILSRARAILLDQAEQKIARTEKWFSRSELLGSEYIPAQRSESRSWMDLPGGPDHELDRLVDGARPFNWPQVKEMQKAARALEQQVLVLLKRAEGQTSFLDEGTYEFDSSAFTSVAWFEDNATFESKKRINALIEMLNFAAAPWPNRSSASLLELRKMKPWSYKGLLDRIARADSSSYKPLVEAFYQAYENFEPQTMKDYIESLKSAHDDQISKYVEYLDFIQKKEWQGVFSYLGKYRINAIHGHFSKKVKDGKAEWKDWPDFVYKNFRQRFLEAAGDLGSDLNRDMRMVISADNSLKILLHTERWGDLVIFSVESNGRNQTDLWNLAAYRESEHASRSEIRKVSDIAVSDTYGQRRKTQREVSKTVGNIFSVQFVNHFSRSEFRDFFEQEFPELANAERNKKIENALKKWNSAVKVSDALVLGPDLAANKKFLDAAKDIFPGQTIAVLATNENERLEFQSKINKLGLKNARVFLDVNEATRFAGANGARVRGWLSVDDAVFFETLKKAVKDTQILSNNQIRNFYSAVGLENLAISILRQSLVLRSA